MADVVLTVRSALAAHPLFAGCSSAELDRLCRVATTLRVDPGYVFTRAGRRGYELFLVLDGTATSCVAGLPPDTLVPGHHFGADGPGGNSTACATVVAATAMQLLALDTREVNSLLAIRAGVPVSTAAATPAGMEG